LFKDAENVYNGKIKIPLFYFTFKMKTKEDIAFNEFKDFLMVLAS
jgi:hypothetical protein